MFGVWAGTFAGVHCALEDVRGKGDPLNSVGAGALAGAVLGARVKGTLGGALGGAAMTAALAGAGEYFSWTMSPGTAKFQALARNRDQRAAQYYQTRQQQQEQAE